MATRPHTRCPSCKTLHPGTGKCTDCARTADRARGNFRQRGYTASTWDPARRACLDRDPVCVLCHAKPSAVADHYPTDRRTLVAQEVPDPDALHRLRGLCITCHNAHTARSRHA